jgi:hypothetical protein
VGGDQDGGKSDRDPDAGPESRSAALRLRGRRAVLRREQPDDRQQQDEAGLLGIEEVLRIGQ